MKYLNTLIKESAEHWGISLRMAQALFWLPIATSIVVFALQIERSIFRWLLQEDGPVEWLSAICFLLTGIVAIRIAMRRSQAAHRWQGLLFVAAGLVMLFAAAEEISWGQRIFGWETPENLAAINDQNEISLHNIGGLLQLTNLAMLLIGLYGTVAYVLNRRLRIERQWDLADYLFIPPFFLAMFFLPSFVFRVLRFTVIAESNFTLNRFGEWAEALIAVGILIFVWLAYLRAAAANRNDPTARTRSAMD